MSKKNVCAAGSAGLGSAGKLRSLVGKAHAPFSKIHNLVCSISLAPRGRPCDSAEGGSWKLLLGRWFGRLTLRKVVPGNYSRGGGSAELLSGRWFRETTLGEVVRPNYVLSERWFQEITDGEVVRLNYSPKDRSSKLSPYSRQRFYVLESNFI